ncbi:hypothetical protein ACFL0M_14995 [Thermodesulfobacteriota bacterium]
MREIRKAVGDDIHLTIAATRSAIEDAGLKREVIDGSIDLR